MLNIDDLISKIEIYAKDDFTPTEQDLIIDALVYYKEVYI